MKKQFILLSGNFPPETGGPAKFTDSFSSWLSVRGFSVLVISTTPGEDISFYRGDINIRLISRNRPLLIRYLLSASAAIRASRRNSVILANGCQVESLLIRLLGGRKYFIKYPGDVVWEQARARKSTTLNIYDYQTSRLRFPYSFLRFVSTLSLRKSTKILVPSSSIRLVCEGWGIGQDKLVTVPNSVGNSFFQQANMAKKFDVITVSRLISIKNIEEIILVAKSLGIRLLVVGDGPMMSELRLLSAKLEASVTFYGNASQDELMGLYDSAKVFVLNSEFEAGTPYSLLEARAKGILCIGRENTGSEDVITNDVDGLLCGDKSGLNLQAAIEYALGLSENERLKFSQRAIADTASRFSEESVFNRILAEIYSDAR